MLESILNVPGNMATFNTLFAQSSEPFDELTTFMTKIDNAIKETNSPDSAEAKKQKEIINEKIKYLHDIFKNDDFLNATRDNIEGLWKGMVNDAETFIPFIKSLPEHATTISLRDSLDDFKKPSSNISRLHQEESI